MRHLSNEHSETKTAGEVIEVDHLRLPVHTVKEIDRKAKQPKKKTPKTKSRAKVRHVEGNDDVEEDEAENEGEEPSGSSRKPQLFEVTLSTDQPIDTTVLLVKMEFDNDDIPIVNVSADGETRRDPTFDATPMDGELEYGSDNGSVGDAQVSLKMDKCRHGTNVNCVRQFHFLLKSSGSIKKNKKIVITLSADTFV